MHHKTKIGLWADVECSPVYLLISLQDGVTALFVAAQNGHLRVVEQLIAANTRFDIQRKVKFNTTLFS